MYIESTVLSLDNGAGGSGSIVPAAGDWHISCIDWAATTARSHNKDWTTGGAWSHANTGSLAGFKAGPGTGGWFNIGLIGDNDSVGQAYGVIGVWSGVQLGDTVVQELGANARTSDWWNCSSGQPDLLIECNVAMGSLVDIGANPSTYSSANSSGMTLTGGDPPGWTFDGQGGAGDQGGPYEFKWT